MPLLQHAFAAYRKMVGMEIKSFLAGVAFSALLLIAAILIANAITSPPCAQATPLFSPDASDEIISMMREAKETIEVEMYVFTDDALARELSDAQKRGVQVRVILEGRVNSKASTQTIPAALEAAGVQVRWASLQYALTHSKMMIIDGKKVLIGSINFSKSAQHKNREAAAVLECPEDASQYSEVFEKDWKDAMEIAPS